MDEQKKIRRMTRQESFKAYEILKESIVQMKNGFCEYKSGLSDEIVAKMVAPDLNKWAVKDIRASMFGQLASKAVTKVTRYEQISQRVDELESLHLKLLDRVERLEGKSF